MSHHMSQDMSTYEGEVDIIVVGAGPSGSTAARKFALQGYTVMILDKSSFPRYKVCGGGLTLRAQRELDIDVSSIVRDSISQMELCVSGQLRRTFTRRAPFIQMVMRDEFDDILLKAALDAGVKFLHARVTSVLPDESGVTVVTDNGTFRSGYIIGADGVNSVVAKQVGLMSEKKRILALEYEMKVSAADMARYQGKVAIDYGFIDAGYAWVFPKHDHLSVGVGLGTSDGKFLQDKLAEYLKRENLHGEFVSEKGFWLSLGASDTNFVRGRVALVGDAAGLVDPFMGEGIYYALRSANLIAETFAEGRKRSPSSPFTVYAERVEGEMIREMRLFERVSTVFYRRPKRFHRLFLFYPGIVQQAFKVIAGELAFSDYYQKYRKKWIVKSVVRAVRALQ